MGKLAIPENRICEICGNVFVAKYQTYTCSACKSAMYRKNNCKRGYLPSRNKKPKELTTCLRCDREFMSEDKTKYRRCPKCVAALEGVSLGPYEDPTAFYVHR